MEDSKRASRRRHGAELKREVLAACARPGVSVAQVALAHGLNANLVHKWRRLAGASVNDVTPKRNDEFLAVALAPSPATMAGEIRIEVRRGAMTVNVNWPVGAASGCAAWLRELLR